MIDFEMKIILSKVLFLFSHHQRTFPSLVAALTKYRPCRCGPLRPRCDAMLRSGLHLG